MTAQPYTPNIAAVRDHWVASAIGSGETAEAHAEFDRFLARVQAEAWDEGWEACHAFMGRGIFPPCRNPYRQEADRG